MVGSKASDPAEPDDVLYAAQSIKLQQAKRGATEHSRLHVRVDPDHNAVSLKPVDKVGRVIASSGTLHPARLQLHVRCDQVQRLREKRG